VFTLLTLTIGEELESRFFKVLSCVGCMLYQAQILSLWLLTSVSNAADPNRSMRIDVAGCRYWNGAAVNQRQDVLCTLLGNGFVPEKEICGKRACREAKFGESCNELHTVRWET